MRDKLIEKGSNPKTFLQKITIRLLIISLFTIFILFSAFLLADKLFPLTLKQNSSAQTVLASDGTPLWRFADKNGIWRYYITVDQVPDYYLQALLNYEDRHFYHHIGINPLSLLRASWQNLSNGTIVSGGSTLSMQVARLIDPHKRTFWGKLKQIFRTLQLEWHYSKTDILTLYLNYAPYGGTVEGIGAASWRYFGKPPSALTRSEAVLLAVLPQAPSRLRPDRYPERAKKVRDRALDRLTEIWSPDIIEQIRHEEVWVYPRKTVQHAPLLARRLVKQYPNLSTINSTIDFSLQYSLEDIAMNWKDQLPAKNSLAILVVDHTTMAVKGYVGSVDFKDNKRAGQVDMITALRSPGSTLKPFIYGLSIDEGMIHSASLLQDIPRLTSNYRPTNFDEGFTGPVSATDALKKSLNLPAVQLFELYGSKKFTAKLRSAGLSLTSIGGEPNISYILGGASVRMDELMAAYSAFARGGMVSPLRFIKESDEILDSQAEHRLLSTGSAWITKQMLLNQNGVTYKTGTSYGYRDAWAVGFNPRYLIGVWVGRPDGTPVVGQYGAVTAVPILQQVNTMLLNRERNLNRPLPVDIKPDSVSRVTICWPTGQKLPADDPNCHRQKQAWILDGMIPPTLDLLSIKQVRNYRTDRITVWLNQEGKRTASDCSGAVRREIALWPIGLENWLLPSERRSNLIPPIDEKCPPFGQDTFTPLIITGLVNNQIVRLQPNQKNVLIKLKPQGGSGHKWWFLDGELKGNLSEYEPFEFQLTSTIHKGKHTILLLDESGQIARVNFRFE
ncbi:penicillin-binding protein 1C [Orbaceae bacterium ESL0721]|nr:penicillin-binding protein 1C [Orbaceae bacterium ESL0721]